MQRLSSYQNGARRHDAQCESARVREQHAPSHLREHRQTLFERQRVHQRRCLHVRRRSNNIDFRKIEQLACRAAAIAARSVHGAPSSSSSSLAPSSTPTRCPGGVHTPSTRANAADELSDRNTLASAYETCVGIKQRCHGRRPTHKLAMALDDPSASNGGSRTNTRRIE